MLLEVKGVQVCYGKTVAVKGVSMSVEQGKIVALIGANGAGKTTVLNAICGVKRPSAGTILFDGKPIERCSCDEIVRRGIAQVPEGRHIFPRMTVFENLRMGAYLSRDNRQFRKDLAEVWSYFPILNERQKQMAGSLSGGEQQMLAIGRALVARPKLMLLDEPTLGLSPIMMEGTAKVIQDINATGVSVLLVEQSARLALKLAHTGYVLETGKVALEGPASELVNNPYLKKAYLGG